MTNQVLYPGSNDAPYEGGKLLYNLLLFGRVCRGLSMDITPNRMLEVARALEFVEVGRKADFYYTLRALMISRQRDLALFEEAFRLFWQPPTETWTTFAIDSLGDNLPRPQRRFVPPPNMDVDEDEPDSKPTLEHLIAITFTYSTNETLRYKDFAEMTSEEILMARQLMEKLPWSLGVRQTRRFSPGKGLMIDPRRALRQNMRYGGEPLLLPTRARKIKPRPLILLCDISGSMERYTRLLLHFTHTLASSWYQVESFVFSTKLTRITRPLRHKSVDQALKDVGTSVTDWGGGTRTGEALRTFNYRWSRRVLRNGAIVLLITDGWDRGDPELLQHEAARLQRSCSRLIWLNPLIGGAQYEPLTRGAQALLPYVDDFLPVRNLANLEALAKELWKVNWRRPEQAAHRHLII
jgi:uncharacterized protein